MNVRNEVRSLIAKNGTTLKKVCERLSEEKGVNIPGNNMTNKFRRKTVKFDEVQGILEILGYSIEFVKK